MTIANEMWVLVANSSAACLYSSANLRVDALHLFKEYSHGDSRKKVSDLVSDKPGHSQTDTGARVSFAKDSPKEVEAEHFAQELIKELRANCNFEQIKSLVIVAPDGFYNLIHKHYDASHNYQEKLVHIAKDYTKYDLQKLTAALREHLFV